jgi:CelD/BcsL family acetyltransferase involved in cellulose biosynthesis
MMHMFIEELFRENHTHLLDFLFGNQAYKRSFGNSQREVASLFVSPRNRWHTILALQRALFAVERCARSSMTRLKLEHPLRNVLKRIGANVRRYG